MRIGALAGSALLTAGVLALSACGSSDGPSDSASDAASNTASDGRVVVVASTNVWGDVVKQVGGDAVEVTSIISDPDQDPHSYEANATTALAISKASLVIENGGGYDDFVDQLLSAHESKAVVLNAVDISGKTAPAGGELNEHVWYDLPTVAKVADQIADQLGTADPADAATFTANAEAFKTKLDGLIADEAALKKTHAGDGIGITEPVPLYMTEAAGLANKTPGDFSEAIEEGDDVSAATLKETLDLYSEHQVDALVYNEQTSGTITEKVEKAAKDAGIAVVPVTETLPSGLDYVGWMQKNIDALAAALG
jgi:zinc/manganese transport system substrate-binding protein